jgi:hypothetical protein
MAKSVSNGPTSKTVTVGDIADIPAEIGCCGGPNKQFHAIHRRKTLGYIYVPILCANVGRILSFMADS